MAKAKGWFSVHRCLIDSEFWLSEKFTRPQAWIDLLALANHKDGYYQCRGIKVMVKRGQCGYSKNALAERWKWSRGRVLRFLRELEMEQQIDHQKTNVTTLITIVNYEKYQDTQYTKQSSKQYNKRYTNNNDNNKRTHTGAENQELSTGKTGVPICTYIAQDFYPDEQTIEYCAARRLPDPLNQVAIDEFINANLSSNWTSANWQAEYRRFLPKWKLRNEKSDKGSKAQQSLDALRKL